MAKKVKCCTILNRTFRLGIAKLHNKLNEEDFTGCCMGFAMLVISIIAAYIFCWIGIWITKGSGYNMTCEGEMKYRSNGDFRYCFFANDTIDPNVSSLCNDNNFVGCFFVGLFSIVLIIVVFGIIISVYEGLRAINIFDFCVAIAIVTSIMFFLWLAGVLTITGFGYDTHCLYEMKNISINTDNKKLRCVFANDTVDFNFNELCNFQTYNSMINGCLLIGYLTAAVCIPIIAVLSGICIAFVWLIRKYRKIEMELSGMDV
uniref:Uncharacterized protein n=1 Tax=Marseillevirus LCMAC102 TaxID=2506603 RepID=A0A481YU99_9VIRU|nr:MAG: hypothetical protein LCMAC102_01400 [Marseillevirus LCMAC102]